MAESRALPRTPLVLVVDDQEWTARSIESILGSGGSAVLKAYTGRQALDLARKVRPDAVIVDMHLPDMTGADVCLAMKELPTVGPGTPLLVLTTTPLGRQERVAVIRAGAWDILRPPFDPDELMLKVSTFVSAKMDADLAREESLCDPLTGLYNVKGVLRRVDEITADAARNQRPLACVVLGLDQAALRQVGGAAAAGEGGAEFPQDPEGVTVQVARALAGATRLSDTLGRLGPADFVIVAPGTDEDGASRLARRLVDALAASPELSGLHRGDGAGLRAGFCAVRNPRVEPVIPVDLLTRATMALRRAQAQGAVVPFGQN